MFGVHTVRSCESVGGPSTGLLGILVTNFTSPIGGLLLVRDAGPKSLPHIETMTAYPTLRFVALTRDWGTGTRRARTFVYSPAEVLDLAQREVRSVTSCADPTALDRLIAGKLAEAMLLPSPASFAIKARESSNDPFAWVPRAQRVLRDRARGHTA